MEEPVSMRSVVFPGTEGQFHMPRDFGDSHRLGDGEHHFYITPGYTNANGAIQKFPHVIVPKTGSDVEDILSHFIPNDTRRKNELNEIMSTYGLLTIENDVLYFPRNVVSVITQKKNRATALLLPEMGIAIKFTHKGQGAGGYPDLREIVRQTRESVNI